ncbi:MAG: phosphohistidine phosphatase SixA [Gemmatimonadetes bacterium 13_1_40CM_70_11]|nr:MAG: phosphohistidine phosphatase SixA [Gemmatimonadetes bacterium 13_1_40CM_70_11]
MELFLVQHGDARPEQEDPTRPLSERGWKDVERVAHAAARLDLRMDAIMHSGKLRARQTAEILARELRPARGCRDLTGLSPNDDPAIIGDMIAKGDKRPTMFVGHMPHLSRLASTLLVGDAGKELIAFRMGAIVHLEGDHSGWRLKWILTPELVP